MKPTIHTTPALLLATASLAFAPAAFAESGSNTASDVTIGKHSRVAKDVEYAGRVELSGTIDAEALGMAVIEGKQSLRNNVQTHAAEQSSDDAATLGDDALNGARGNIGINTAAGDNNAQANAAALAAADSEFVFGHGDAQVFVDQKASGNSVSYHRTSNAAVINGDALRDAKGNIGVNVAAGTTNAQHNGLALATGADSLSEASVSTQQTSVDNGASGAAPIEMEWSNHAALDRNALRDARGNIGANVAAGRNNLQSNSLSLSKVGE